jgi:putative flippase GtrA
VRAPLSREVLRFLAGGVVNTVLSFALYYALQLVMPYQAAYALAFVFGVALSYAINVFFVFRTGHTAGKALAFPLVYLAQYVAGALLLAALVEWLGMPQEIAPLVVVVLTLPLTFALSRFVLRSRPGQTPPDPAHRS